MKNLESTPNPSSEIAHENKVAPAAADSVVEKMPRRKAFKKFVDYTAPAVIALLTTRDASASP